MTRTRTWVALLAAALLPAASAGVAHAGGFLIPETSARATGRADAVTATDTDASAAYYNPGGLGFVDGVVVGLGGTVVVPDATFTQQGTSDTTEMNSGPAIIPNLYAAAQVNSVVRVGVGFNIPFGSTVQWPSDSPGADVVRTLTLRAPFVSPVLGLDLSRWVPGLSVGGGVDLVPASVELKRDIFFGGDVGSAHLAGNGFGVGGRGGVMLRPPSMPWLSLGATYRSKVKIDFDGNGNFDAPPPYRSTLPPDGSISTSITLPQSIAAGVAFRVLPDFELEGDVNWTGWSSFDQLDITLPDGSHSVTPEGYRDTYTWRAGAEYRLPRYALALRAGYAYDPTPIPRQYLTVQLPDINRQVVSVGASYEQLPWDARLDAGVMWVLPGSRTTADTIDMPELKGTYDLNAWVVGLGFSVDLGRRSHQVSRPVAKAIASRR